MSDSPFSFGRGIKGVNNQFGIGPGILTPSSDCRLSGLGFGAGSALGPGASSETRGSARGTSSDRRAGVTGRAVSIDGGLGSMAQSGGENREPKIGWMD